MQQSCVAHVLIQGLRIPCRLGVSAEERSLEQAIVVDLTMPIQLKQAARHDDIAHVSANYQTVASQLTDWVAQSHYRLLETLVEEMAIWLHTQFSLKWLRLQITKPQAIEAADGVSILVERHFL